MIETLAESAAQLAREAGAFLRRAYRETSTVEHKGTVDLVTEADRGAERLILDGIAAQWPDHDVLAEETGARPGVSGAPASSYRWVVDPLDGTVNFAHRLPHFSVLLAVQIAKADGYDTVVAVTYDPMRDELFVARKGMGASLNGEEIGVSTAEALIHTTLATGFGYDRLFGAPDNHREFCRLNLLSRGVRRFGSAGLDLAYVACGRFDGYWEYGLNPWDLTGGVLLVGEAGGRVTQMNGTPYTEGAATIMATNGVLHRALGDALGAACAVPANSREDLLRFLPDSVRSRVRPGADGEVIS